MRPRRRERLGKGAWDSPAKRVWTDNRANKNDWCAFTWNSFELDPIVVREIRSEAVG